MEVLPEKYRLLVKDIQGLSEVETEEIFKIIHSSKCDYTHNNNGIFVNLAWLQPSTIEQIEKYVRFCNKSKKELTKYESLCDVLNNKMCEYTDSAVVQELNPYSSSSNENVEDARSSKVSSSMRYYLLKKRYAKQQTTANTFTCHLSKDAYIL
jgi:predicted nucleic acid binding AN1-type Zn finger protein